jgi:uncharacterized protein (DUF302 family)
MTTSINNGIISKKSPHDVKKSLDLFQQLLAAKGIVIFGRIDQQAEARKVGLDLPPTELIIFGNPLAGTLIMDSFPMSALDLPLKLLAWSHEGSDVWLVYNDPAYLGERYGLPDEMVKKLDFGTLVDKVIHG